MEVRERCPEGTGSCPPEEIHWRAARSSRASESRAKISIRLLERYLDDLAGLFIVSQVVLERGHGTLEVEIERAAGQKCERCWKYTTDVGKNPEFPTVCAPCAEAVEEIRGE